MLARPRTASPRHRRARRPARATSPRTLLHAGTASRRRSVLVISGSVGAGHDGAAAELARRLRAGGLDVDVRDYLQGLAWPFPVLLRQGYTLSVGRVPAVFEWLFHAIESHASVRLLVWLLCRTAQARVTRWCRQRPYSAVVSTYPLASQTLGELRRRGQVAVPVVTYLTDPAAHRCWVHEHVDHHWTVTSATAAQGQADYGVPMRAVGPLVAAHFLADEGERHLTRRELGIDPGQRVALLVAGSLGLGDVEEAAAVVVAAGLLPLVLCGRNEPLRARVAAVPGALALGWRTDVHRLMRACDVLVHNAGGLTFTEALVAGLPAVSYRCIPGHGLANAAVLHAAGLAAWARTDAELGPLLHEAVARGRVRRELPDPATAVEALLRRAPRAGAPLAGAPLAGARRAPRRRVRVSFGGHTWARRPARARSRRTASVSA